MTLALYIMGGAVIALAIAIIWQSLILEKALKDLAMLTGEKLGQVLAHVRKNDTASTWHEADQDAYMNIREDSEDVPNTWFGSPDETMPEWARPEKDCE